MNRADGGSPEGVANSSRSELSSSTPSSAPLPAPLSRREAREQERQESARPAVRSAASAVAPSASRRGAVARPKAQRATRPGTPRAARPNLLRTLMSASAMTGVFALLVTSTLHGLVGAPVSAEADQLLATGETLTAEVQSLGVVAADAEETPQLARDSYTAHSYVPPVVYVPPVRFTPQPYGATSPNFNYVPNPSGSVQWPLAQASPISYGFGPRSACSYCSTYHLGVDFVPGAGVAIQSIADGVVVAARLEGGGFGNHVIVEHLVNGQRIRSLYAHMQWGSIQVAEGQQVGAGTVLGAVGSTGASTGAHLHLEIHVDGTPIDPFAWLKANAN